MNEKPSIIFMGTPEFAVPALRAINNEFGLSAVVTVPDKPKGRGLAMQFSPVKSAALELGLPVLQPEKLKDEAFIKEIEKFDPDIIIVIAFRILPVDVYTKAKIGAFNVHGSLLPKYRGAAPINWAIINGDKLTGLTSFLLKEKVDTGDMLDKVEIEIPDGTTAGDLHDMLMPLAANLAVETTRKLVAGDFTTYIQDNTAATPAPKLFKDTCRIDWQKDAETLRNFIHGVSPIPGAWTEWNSSRLKILRADLSHNELKELHAPGDFIIKDLTIYIKCGKGILIPKEIQTEGKKAMKTEDFLRGYRGETEGSFI